MIEVEEQLTVMLRTRAARVDPPARLDEIEQGIDRSRSRTFFDVNSFVSLSNAESRRPRHRLALLVATAACLVLLAAGIAVVAGRDTVQDARPAISPQAPSTNQPTPQPVPAGTPALLAPTASGGVVTVRRGSVDGSGLYNGAVVGPDGTVFGLGLSPTVPLGEDFTFETRTIGGLSASAVVDGTAPDQIYRNIEIGCATLTVTTAGEAMWSPDIETIVHAISAADDTVSLDLPAGWTSLGATSVSKVYFSDLSATVDGAQVQVSMWQAVDAPVGFYLSSMETPPVELSDGGLTLWHIASATTPTHNTVVGELNGTAFRLGAEAPLDALTTVVNGLVAISRTDWLQQADPAGTIPTDTIEVISEQPATASCELTTLAVRTR